MTSPSPVERTRSFYHAPSPLTAAIVTCAGALTIYIVQIGFAGLIGPLPAAAASFVVTAAVVLKVAHDLGLSLGVTRAPSRFWVAAVLIGMSVWLLDLQIVTLVNPPKVSDTLDQVVARDPLWATMLVLAVLPAIGEELLFRGVLLRSLAHRRDRRWIAVGVSAIVFSTYHLDPPQIVGTLLFGIALGTLATGARSIVPGMLAHFLNNAVVLVIARVRPEPIVGFIDAYPGLTLAICTGEFVDGVALCARSEP